MAAGHGEAPDHGNDVFHHVRDNDVFEVPGFLGGEIPLPKIDLPLIGEFEITKFMVLQVVAGLLVLLIFRGLARRVRDGQPAPGRWWNFWETKTGLWRRPPA